MHQLRGQKPERCGSTTPRKFAARGFTLVDILTAIAILGIIAVAFALYFNPRANAQHADAKTLTGLFGRARALATTNGAGATLSFATRDDGHTAVTLYAFRPEPGANQPPALDTTILASSQVSIAADSASLSAPAAIFFDPSGGVSAASWTPGSAGPSVEPTCTNVSLAIAPPNRPSDPAATSLSISCSNGQI